MAPDARSDSACWAGPLAGPNGVSVGHLDHVRDLGDHAADRGGVVELATTADAVQAETLEGRALVLLAPDRAAGLNDGDLGHDVRPQPSVAASAEAPSALRP